MVLLRFRNSCLLYGLLHGIAECVSDENVAFLNSRSLFRRNRDKRVNQTGQLAAGGASQSDRVQPHVPRADHRLNYAWRASRSADGDRYITWTSQRPKLT